MLPITIILWPIRLQLESDISMPTKTLRRQVYLKAQSLCWTKYMCLEQEASNCLNHAQFITVTMTQQLVGLSPIWIVFKIFTFRINKFLFGE